MPVRPLSKELQQKAEDELNEVPDRIQEDIKYIRDWLSTQPDLTVKTDDQWLLSFLRSCKFNYQRTKEKLEFFFTQQQKVTEFFGNRDPFSDEVQEILKAGVFTILPQAANPAGSKIIFVRMGRCDPAKINVRSLVKVVLMIMEILYLEDDNCAVAGVSATVDLRDFSYKYLAQMTPNSIKKMFDCFIHAYPTRLQRASFINAPAFFSIIFALLKIFAPGKIKNRLHIHSDASNICKDIPQAILPKDYGGEDKACDELAAEWKLKIESYKKWFSGDSKYCTNEDKQIESTKLAEEMVNEEEIRN